MRLSLATAACVVSVALLAGCSNQGTGTSTVPGSTGTSTAPMSRTHREHAPMIRFFKPSEVSKSHILKMMAEGKFPSRVLHDAFERGYKHFLSHPKFRPDVVRDGKPTAIWNNLFYYDYLIGTTAKAHHLNIAVATDSGTSNYCYYPQAIKVDANQNVWTACEYANGTDGFALQEYNSSGALVNQYTSTCPNGYSCNDYWFSYAFDAAVNTAGQCGVLPEYEAENYSSASGFTYQYGTGLICFSSPSDEGTVYYAWQCNQNGSCTGLGDCTPICEAWEGDMDSSGDVYYTYEGESTSCFGGGVAEESGGVTSVVQSPCLLEFPGGVWIAGNDAYVIDQDARLVYEFALPITTSSTPIATYGPTKVSSIVGLGDPDSGGVNAAGTKMVIGDAYGWDDAITFSNNKAAAWKNINFIDTGVEAAGFTPSDKP